MLLAALILLASPKVDAIWRSHTEVYAILQTGRRLVVATSGGVLGRDGNGPWRSLGHDSPVGLRHLWMESDGRLAGGGTDGSSLALGSDGVWRQGETRPPSALAAEEPPSGCGGAFLSARAGDVYSFWGARSLYRREGGRWSKWIDRPPSDGDYALATVGGNYFAGTNDGLWAYDGKGWRREPIPSELPQPRVQGLASAPAPSGDRWLLGGLTGLFLGRPGSWESASSEPVRQIVSAGEAAWVLYGSGAVDKLETKLDRRYPDVFHGNAKRPWSSVLSICGDTLLAGGNGGWIEKGPKGMTESYPPELKGQIVTAILGEGSTRWIGTQAGGLIRFGGSRISRWNPANGLADPWVTALVKTPDGLIVGTSVSGLYRIGTSGRLEPIVAPSARVRHLAYVNGRLVLGALEGAWVKKAAGWQAITRGEETTGLTPLNHGLAVLTATGVHFLRDQ